tara:strand:+ start:4384 stop:5142 length:759 start_codon:yes stop_codon:yes gene_type:complete
MFYSKKLKKINKINHCFFSRKNGHSKGIYKSLNCGLGSKDERKKVVKNLRYVSKKIGVDFNNLILMNQTHSNKVINIKKHYSRKQKLNCDALITQVKGLALGVLTADCVPIIVCDKKNNVIACIHAGWRGAFNGIIEKTIKKIKKLKRKNNLVACIGPCIGKKSYEVDRDFYKKFFKQNRVNKVFFANKNKNKYFFNIRNYIEAKLIKLGVSKIDHIDFDTFQKKDHFFSYRRSRKMGQRDYGRCISVICLK